MSNENQETSFSFVDWSEPPKPILDSETFTRVASLIKLDGEGKDTVYLHFPPGYYGTLVERAGLSWTDFLQSSTYPAFRLVGADLDLLQAMGHGIYSVNSKGAFSRHYYLKFIPDNRRVFLCYQHIIGSRLLYKMTEEQLEALESSFIAQLQAFGLTSDYRAIQARAEKVRQSIAERERREARPAPAAKPAETAPIAKKALEQLALMTPRGHELVLPSEHLSQYDEIKRMLEVAGAKYSRKLPGFVFDTSVDAAAVQAQLLNGETVNPKKDFQFFASTDKVVELIRNRLPEDLTGCTALEPSAGDGVLADLVKDLGATVKTVELWDQNVKKLQAKGYSPVAQDFLKLTPAELGLFDVIVANPPFTKGQDIKHLMHMTRFLKPTGVVHCVMSTSWLKQSTRAAKEFREFLGATHAEQEDLPAGTFQESGTSVGAVLVTLRAENLKNANPLPLAA